MGQRGSLEARFERLVAEVGYPGAQVAVRSKGREVLRWCGGLARGLRPGQAKQEVEHDTLFPCFSAGKPVVAAALMLLEEAGSLDVADPVARWWPAFGANGKADVTVLDVLTHRSGFLAPELCRAAEGWSDLSALRAAIAAAPLRFPRGTLAYAPLEFGWILGAVVERVSGRPFPRFVAERIAEPLGRPDLLFAVPEARRRTLAHAHWLGPSKLMVAGNNVAATFEATNNSPLLLDADTPGAGLATNACTLAAFYEALMPGAGGPRLAADATLRRWFSEPRLGWDRSNGVPLRVGRGVLFGTWFPSAYGMWATSRVFGHAGGFGVLAFADPEAGLCGAVVTDGHRGRNELVRDFAPLVAGIRRQWR